MFGDGLRVEAGRANQSSFIHQLIEVQIIEKLRESGYKTFIVTWMPGREVPVDGPWPLQDAYEGRNG
jgi:hypothetical protein